MIIPLHIFTRKEVRVVRLTALMLFAFSVSVVFVQSAIHSRNTSAVRVGEQVVRQLASPVGVSAGVAQNGLNTLAQELREKEQLLLARENELGIDASMLRARILAQENRETRLFILSLIASSLLFLLITWNFYLDYRRHIEEQLHHAPFVQRA